MSTGYRESNVVEEGHHSPIYCITFNFCDLKHKDIFASVGKNRASVYSCGEKGAIDLLQVYIDEDKEEFFFVCKWSQDEVTGAPILLVAGKNGIVRALDCSNDTLVHSFKGHGNSVNDIAVHPTKPSLFITASKDESLRLWNLRSRSCVVVVTGVGGHVNEVLTADWQLSDMFKLVSAGMDNMIKIWSFKMLQQQLEDSHTHDQDGAASFPAKVLTHPIFSSVQVHVSYVDCVRWLGDLILSKSVDNKILLWKPSDLDESGIVTSRSFTVLQEFSLPDSRIWWVRFSLDFQHTILACGNKVGRVYVFNPHESSAHIQLRIPNSKAVVRQTAVSYDGSTILACCDDATIWRWDLMPFDQELEDQEQQDDMR